MSIHLGEGSLYYPTFWQHHETLGLDRMQDCLDDDTTGLFRPFRKPAFSVRAICKDHFESFVFFTNSLKHKMTAFVVLKVSRMQNGNQQ